MKHPYFKNIILSGLAGGAIVSIYLIILSLTYQDPLNAKPKSFDILFYVLIPVASILFYKTKINHGRLEFKEALVKVSLVNALMLVFTCVTLGILLYIKPSILQNDIDLHVKQLVINKVDVLKKLEGKGMSFEDLITKIKGKSIGIVLLQEVGIKLIVGLFTSIVAATAFRSKGDLG